MSLSWWPRPDIAVTPQLIDKALKGGASPADIVIWLRSVMVSRGADPADGWVLEVPRRFSFWMSNNLIQPDVDWGFIRFRTGEEIRVERPMQQADVEMLRAEARLGYRPGSPEFLRSEKLRKQYDRACDAGRREETRDPTERVDLSDPARETIDVPARVVRID